MAQTPSGSESREPRADVIITSRNGDVIRICWTPARFPWHEVTKVDHYYLAVDAMTQPMKVKESEPPPYGSGDESERKK